MKLRIKNSVEGQFTRKLLLTCILIMSIVFGAGCIDEDNTIDSKTLLQGALESKATNYQEDMKQAEQTQLKQVKHFIDPKLKNFQIEINNPNIEIVSFRLNDYREYETDTKWSVELVIQNNAKVPVWITPLLARDSVRGSNSSMGFTILDSGERRKCFIQKDTFHGNNGLENFLEYKSIGQIIAYDTVKPKISPEFNQIKISASYYSTHTIETIAHSYSVPTLDINSIEYETNERGWKYMIVEVTNPSNSKITAIVNGESFFMNPRETKSLKRELNAYNPEDIKKIYISAGPDPPIPQEEYEWKPHNYAAKWQPH